MQGSVAERGEGGGGGSGSNCAFGVRLIGSSGILALHSQDRHKERISSSSWATQARIVWVFGVSRGFGFLGREFDTLPCRLQNSNSERGAGRFGHSGIVFEVTAYMSGEAVWLIFRHGWEGGGGPSQ